MPRISKTKYIPFLIFLVVALYLFVSHIQFFQSAIYPFKYQNIIIEEAQRNGLDPLLVASVIRVESGFRESAESTKGARGLMQVMPPTGLWVAEQKGMDDYCHEQLFEPNVNIAIGTWYLSNLSHQFDRNPYLVLSAYNSGRGNVSNWLKDGIWDGTGENIKDIPYLETRSYVWKVERVYMQYKNIYSYLENGEANLIFEDAVVEKLPH